VIQKRLVDPLALGLLKGEFASGDTIVVDAEEGGLAFTRTRPAPDEEAQRQPAVPV
jgi:ATP-dependent Clp protease ATP-binding subunit ClpB